jgi:hypothetical protein
MNNYSALFSLLFTLLLVPWQSSDQLAIVTGRVLDAQGQPVAGAKISVFPMAAITGGLPYAVSGEDGHFRLVSPPFGDTWLCAVKERAGYPDTNALLFAPEVDNRPKVPLTPGSHQEIDLHLGPPDGVLEGYLVDASTRQAITKGRIEMHRAKPDAMYSATIADGHFLFALPFAPIEISITAPGHAPWQYKDAQNGSNKLILSNSEHRVLTIDLVSTENKQPAQ